MRSFDDDVFITKNPDTALSRINSSLDRLQCLINDAVIDNISQSAKDRIQVLAKSLNGSDMNKTSGKITEVLEKLTTQQEESTLNATTPKGPMSETKTRPCPTTSNEYRHDNERETTRTQKTIQGTKRELGGRQESSPHRPSPDDADKMVTGLEMVNKLTRESVPRTA